MLRTNYFFTLFFFCYCFTFQAQEKESLIDVIPALEARFEVKFSYSVNEVKGIVVNKPNKTETLNQIIEDLNANTLLNFKFLNERYITISQLDKTISICGRLVSSTDNAPLFGASVVINNSTKGTVTNEEGGFQLDNVALNETIVISFLGYETQAFAAKELWEGNGCKTIVLSEKNEALNEVLISKFLTTGLQKLIDGSTVLNTEKFGILPGLTDPDILQSIQALPGIESVNESIANINVRGGTNDQNLILWDGIKMYHAGHFFGLISAYNPNLTTKVIVTKNGTSSEFSDGVSSTISMLTKDKIGNEVSGGIGANLLSGDAFFEIPLSKKWAIHVSGRRSFTDFYKSPVYDKYFERSFQDSKLTTDGDNISESNRSSKFFFHDYTAKLLFDLNEKHKFRANVIGINNSLDYKESYIDNANKKESKTSRLKQQNIGAGVNWNGIWTSDFNTELSAFYSKYNVDAVDYRIETDQKLTQTNEVLETSVKLKTNYKINNNLNLLNGYQFDEIGILNGTTVSAPSYERTKKDVLLNHAFFTEAEFKNNATYFRLGVRVNYFQKFNKTIIEPRLNFRQKLNNQVAVKLQGEFKNQSATQIVDFQDDFLGVENRRWILANEQNKPNSESNQPYAQNIPISISKQASFGFDFHHNNLVLDVQGFYKLVKGITASNQGFYNSFQYKNASGSYTAKGVEFLINKTANRFSTWLSYTYSINDYEFKTFTPSVFPNNVDIRHSVSMAFNYDILENLKISIGGIWRSGKPYTKPVEGNETMQSGNTTVVNYGTPNGDNLDDFMRLDASFSYNFKMSQALKASLRAGVLNIMDRKNSINRYFKVDSNDSNSAILIDNKSLGLTPNLSFRIKF
ncbi:TonB-dependent receptor [Yeosuana aromativorans]|uniref:TonB-dependent receptor n=1 Tax=Yeosuana aromativorans TaxID=288019 RepID=A0A8J3BSX4_9FLAO|nr:TonB-dependent receptor [Yeosuana aromativorans]GGK35489.1 TonB-dependent receptor [Yeosuana aromativorans]